MIIVMCDFCGSDDTTKLYYQINQIRNTVSDNYMAPFDDWHICKECLNKLRKVIKSEEKTTD